MRFKYRPSKHKRKEFAQKMLDPSFREEYEKRKRQKEEKKSASSKFDYETAGGYYIPTKHQYKSAIELLQNEDKLTQDQKSACNMVIYGFSTSSKVSHDNIHIVNDLRRKSFL